jgi:hypothetical protein
MDPNDEGTSECGDDGKTEDDMRTVNTRLVEEYAEQIRPLLPLAAKAVGAQSPDSPARMASDKVNTLIREYMDEKGGNMTHLSHELVGDITLAGLRRRLRAARGKTLGTFSTSPKRGTSDPERVKAAADQIRQARALGSKPYRDAVRSVYSDNVSLSAVADELDQSYYSLWSAGTAG